MRAICGAIITAGSLIGLGLFAVGFGTRYGPSVRTGETASVALRLHEMDAALAICLWFLIASAVVGMAVAFLGLAYHHHRRYHEHMRAFPADAAGTPRMTV